MNILRVKKEEDDQKRDRNEGDDQKKHRNDEEGHHHLHRPRITRSHSSFNPSLLLLIITTTTTTILSLIVVFYPQSSTKSYDQPRSRPSHHFTNSLHLTLQPQPQHQITVDEPDQLPIESVQTIDRSPQFINPSSSLPRSTSELSQVVNLTIFPNFNTSISPSHQRQLIHPFSAHPSSFLNPSPAPYSYQDSRDDHKSFRLGHSVDQHPLARLPRRDQAYPSPTWPGTDTVYATKTIFVSQASPTMTVYVSNGQIIYPTLPTPNPHNPAIVNYPPSVVFISPSGNPNIVVATVTAMSSAKKFDWDPFDSSSWTVLILIHSSVYFFIMLGFGFVGFGV